MVWFAPGEKHWHGAAPATAMTHIAIQEKKDGKVVDWMDARLATRAMPEVKPTAIVPGAIEGKPRCG